MRLDKRMSHCGRNCIFKQINVSIYSKSFPVCDKRRNLNHWRPCSLCWSSHFSELFPSHIHRQVEIYPCSQMQAHFHRQMARNVFKLFKYDKICGESKRFWYIKMISNAFEAAILWPWPTIMHWATRSSANSLQVRNYASECSRVIALFGNTVRKDSKQNYSPNDECKPAFDHRVGRFELLWDGDSSVSAFIRDKRRK